MPAIDRELKCPHIFCEEEGVRLEIDCSSCAGAQDLSNRGCLSGVIQILCSESIPRTVTLKRHIHKRYREPSFRIAVEAARRLAALNRKITSTDEPSDRRCQTCPASLHRAAHSLRQKLLGNPVGFVKDHESAVSGTMATARNVKCERLEQCLGAARGCLFCTVGGDG